MARRPTLNRKARKLIRRFGAQSGVERDQLETLQSVINSSPSLINQLNTAAGAGNLTSFGVQPAEVNAGGTYSSDTRAITLPLNMLDDPVETAFVLGHEVQHALNRAESQQARWDFEADLARAAQPDQPHDYTAALSNMIDAQRKDEASAHVAGWNSLVEQMTAGDPDVTLDDIGWATPRAADFVELDDNGLQQPRRNLITNSDLSLDLTAANIEGMGQNYFDKSPEETKLGRSATSDYANYYGAWGVSVAALHHRSSNPPRPGVPEPPMMINMAKVGLDHQLMEQNGINLQQSGPIPYLDTSNHPPVLGLFNDTANLGEQTNPTAPGNEHATEAGAEAVRLAGTSFGRSAAEATRGSPKRSSAEIQVPAAATRTRAGAGIGAPGQRCQHSRDH